MGSDNQSRVTDVPILCGGRWKTIDAAGHQDVYNPSRGEIIARTPQCGPSEVDDVVAAAAAALPDWAATPVVERARLMFAFRQKLAEHFDELARLITREHGKTLAEARGSVQRGLEMVEFACGITSSISGRLLPNIARQIDIESVRHPVGVCVGITPFNFPAMVPLWMFPVALVCGNTFVLKPSDLVPLTAVRLSELLVEAGLPDGVFNLVHGGKTCAEALVTHPHVAAISFVGSTDVARQVYRTGTALGKRVQAAGGAKNHILVMPDADLDVAIAALATSAFGCAGQRCMANSVAVPVGGVGDELVDRLCSRAGELRIDCTDADNDAEMGPLVSQRQRQRVADYLTVAEEEGGRIALDGRRARLPPAGFFLGPSVVDQVTPTMRLAREEVFGPLLSVIRAGTLDEALAIGRECELGNGASIFTGDGYAARQFKEHFNAGMIGINVAVPAPMAWFPFTGWNQSFFGDLPMQGTEGVHFYTRQKTTMTRWFPPAPGSFEEPIWRDSRE